MPSRATGNSICDLVALGDESFDVALAYGGPLSYVFEDAERCLGELVRVTRRGGVVVASVMSLLGGYRHFLSEVADIDERLGFAVNDTVIADHTWWDLFLDREEAMCSEPGAIDGGNHILFAIERNEDLSPTA